ncbi:MAG: hypothetical protein QXO03_00295 [Thermoplasmatales archaeon]
MDIMIDVGAPILKEALLAMEEEGVVAVYYSMETSNGDLFRMSKPGDSLDMRIRLFEEAGNVGP